MNSKSHLAIVVLLSSLATGCGSSARNAAEEHAAKVDNALSNGTTGSLPPGCYLRAVIDGKKWEATEMTPDPSQRSIVPVNGKSGNSSITFVIGSMRDNVGKPSNLSEINTITYWGGDAFFVGAKSGQVTVQKMEDQFTEGTFNFTAEKDGRKVTCTDGEFRIPSPTRSPAE